MAEIQDHTWQAEALTALLEGRTARADTIVSSLPESAVVALRDAIGRLQYICDERIYEIAAARKRDKPEPRHYNHREIEAKAGDWLNTNKLYTDVVMEFNEGDTFWIPMSTKYIYSCGEGGATLTYRFHADGGIDLCAPKGSFHKVYRESGDTAHRSEE